MNRSGLKRFALESKKELIKHMEDLGYQGERAKDLSYNWFIRIVILRFLTINKYYLKKDIFQEGLAPEIRRKMVYSSIESLSEVFPNIFKIEEEELKKVLDHNFFSYKFLEDLNDFTIISKEDWSRVEILGWIHQNYILEENQEIISLKRRYKKEEIPLATQLFTPRWIVEYMVENSLGRYWLENMGGEGLVDSWNYYLEGELDPDQARELNIEKIKCYDPAMGTGHILVYAFDLFYDIYEKQGYELGIARKILENNLYGLEIDEKVYNIAYLALLIKGEEREEGFLESLLEDNIELNIACIRETDHLDGEEIGKLIELCPQLEPRELKDFIRSYRKDKMFGSLARDMIYSGDFYRQIQKSLKGSDYEALISNLIKQSRIRQGSYDLVICNPPYIGRRYLPDQLRDMLEEDYQMGKADLFSAFILYSMERTREGGHLAFMTPYVWMFISSYEELREYIIDKKAISSLVQLEYSAFYSATVPICAFSLRNYKTELAGEYIRLSDFKGVEAQPEKTREAIKDPDLDYRYRVRARNFKKIPGSPIAFWVVDELFDLNEFVLLGEIANPRQGLATGNNKKFLRYWHEVDYGEIGFSKKNIEDFHASGKKYAPYNKGGRFRKWYGNLNYVISFDRENYDILSRQGNKLPSRQYYFKEGISWSFVSSSYFGVRYSPEGSVFDVGGSSVFPENNIYYLLGLMCSKLSTEFMKILNPTLNFQVGDVKRIPYIYNEDYVQEVEELVRENISIARDDWNSFESSWDFRIHPFFNKKIQEVRPINLEYSYAKWKYRANKNFYKMKENEERLNKIFTRIYGLEDLIDPRLEEAEVTVFKIVERLRKEDARRSYIMDSKDAMESFLSYFVGCCLGRYSIKGDLITNRKDFESCDYGPFKPLESLEIKSIGFYLKEFLILAYGEEHLRENLDYILERMRLKDLAELEDYFKKDFFDFHNRVFSHRPLYYINKNHIYYKFTS